MKVHLKKEQFELLNKYSKINFNSDHLREENSRIVIVGDKQYFEDLLDLVSDVLANIGFDHNDEPNKFGLQIEEIIDVISKVVYD